MRYKVLMCYAPLAVCRGEWASRLINMSPEMMTSQQLEWTEEENKIGVSSDPLESAYVFPDFLTRQYKDVFLQGGMEDFESMDEFFDELFNYMTDELESAVNFLVNGSDVAFLFEQMIPHLEQRYPYADFVPYTIHMNIDHDAPEIQVVHGHTVNHCDHYAIRQFDELPADEARHANITSRQLKSTAMIDHASAAWSAVFSYTKLMTDSYIGEMYNKLEIQSPTEYEIEQAVLDYATRNSKVSTEVAQSDLLDNLLR